MLSSKVVGVEPTEKDKLKVVIESGKKTKESIFDKILISTGHLRTVSY